MPESQNFAQPDKLISQLLLEDADLRDIVEEFVGELDERINAIRRAHAQLDWRAMQTLSHQLKGAGGSYGYPDISQHAAMMEQRFRAEDVSQFDQWVSELEQLARAARTGLGEE